MGFLKSLKAHVCWKINGYKFQKSFRVWMHGHVYMHVVSGSANVVKASPHCVVCLLLAAR